MLTRRASIRAKLWSSALVGFALMAAADARADQILYQEKFPFTTIGASQDEELRNQGWCGGNAGDAFCDNPPGTVANQGGEGAISVGTGEDGDVGFAFWSQRAISADSFLYTDEYMFNSSELTSVTWYERDSGTDPTHLAFRIGTDWYISDQTWFDNSGDWVLKTADLSTLTFFKRSGAAATLPDGGVSLGGLELPAGQVNAFGFWWDGPKTANSRVDTVTLFGPTTVDLVAGRTIDVGSVTVLEDDGELIVTLKTDFPWCIEEVHVGIGETVDDIPQRRGNPVPGQFPYSDDPICTGEVSLIIPYTGNETVIAVHAEVYNTETFEYEGAWGAGSPFQGRNWATYFLLDG